MSNRWIASGGFINPEDDYKIHFKETSIK